MSTVRCVLLLAGCSRELLALAFGIQRLVQIAPRCSLGVDAKYNDLRALIPGRRLVPLLERNMANGARLANDGRCIDPFDDRITFQVVVKLLSGMPGSRHFEQGLWVSLGDH